jgi:hypothetical protein
VSAGDTVGGGEVSSGISLGLVLGAIERGVAASPPPSFESPRMTTSAANRITAMATTPPAIKSSTRVLRINCINLVSIGANAGGGSGHGNSHDRGDGIAWHWPSQFTRPASSAATSAR